MEEKEQEEGTELIKSTRRTSGDYEEVIRKAYFGDKEVEGTGSSKLNKLRGEILSNGENTHFFISRLHELAFYFGDSAKKENSNYDKELNITNLHVIRVENARELRKAYLSIFNADTRANVALDMKIDFKKVEQDISKTFHFVTNGKLK